jgi:hypothetical protein
LTDPVLSRARSAALAFCRDGGFAPEQLAAIENEPPLLGPVDFERDGRIFTAYRWLGGGRGSDYVQVEVDAGGAVVVRGAHAGTELDPRG